MWASIGSIQLGQLAYPLAGPALASGLRGVPTRVWLNDDDPIELILLAGIVTNGRLYGGVVPLMPQARPSLRSALNYPLTLCASAE